jgi:clan AA aspartic protease
LRRLFHFRSCDSEGNIYAQDAIVDTGFNGWLSLPPDLIDQLNLKWKRRGRAILGDGSECVFNVYEALVIWDGDYLTIPIDEADSEPLVGSSRLCVIIFAYGIVKGLLGKTFRTILRIFYQYRPRFHTETRRAYIS